MIKEYYKKYESSPSYETLLQITKSEIQQELAAKIVIDTLKKIQDSPLEGSNYVQEKALKFCKQQELQKVMTKAQKSLTVVSLKTMTHLKRWLVKLCRLVK